MQQPPSVVAAGALTDAIGAAVWLICERVGGSASWTAQTDARTEFSETHNTRIKRIARQNRLRRSSVGIARTVFWARSIAVSYRFARSVGVELAASLSSRRACKTTVRADVSARIAIM